MRVRTTFWLLVAVLFTGALYAFVLLRDRAAARNPETAGLEAGFDAEAVDRLTVETPDWTAECRNVDGRWRLTAPMQAAADAAVVDRVLGELSLVTGDHAVTPSQMDARGLTLASFGLEPPRARIAIGMRGGGAVTLLLGTNAPFGETLFAKRADAPDIFTVRTNLLAALPAEAAGFRDRRLLEGEASSLARIDLERREGGFVSFSRENDEWLIRQPFEDRADSDRVRELLTGLLAVEVEDIVDTPRADPAAYGLSPETLSATLTIWKAGDSEGTRLELGLGSEQGQARTYARFGSGGPILSVNTNLLVLLAFRAQDFRNRLRVRFDPGAIRKFSLQAGERRLDATRGETEAWMLTEPVQVRGDREHIHAFLDAMPFLQAVGFEEENRPFPEAPPLVQTRLYAGGSATGTLEQVCLLRVLGRAPGEDRYRADTGTGVVFWLEGPAVRQTFGEEPFWEPLRFRDRQMLELGADSIKRITVTRGEVAQIADRDEKGQWIAHDGRRVNRDAVEAMIGATRALKAFRLEAPDTDRVDGYGFAIPSARVDYGLSGDAGIQKTLIFGGTDAAGNRYVRIQGDDLVYVMAPELADILTRDLLQ